MTQLSLRLCKRQKSLNSYVRCRWRWWWGRVSRSRICCPWVSWWRESMMTTVWIGDSGRIGLGFSFQRVVICVTVIISVEQLDNLLVLGLEKQSVGAIKKERRKKGKKEKTYSIQTKYINDNLHFLPRVVVHWPIQWWPQNSRWVSTIVDCWPFPCRSTEWTKTIFKTTRLSINSSMRSAIVDRQMANKAVFDICFSIYRLFIVHRFYVVRETGSKCTHLEMETHRLSLLSLLLWVPITIKFKSLSLSCATCPLQ